MEDKLTYYDVVAHVVPGTIVLGLLTLMPRVFGFAVPWPRSGLVVVAAGIPLAYAVGQVVQALSSIVQPVYYRLWGGMPSAVIMEGRNAQLSGPRLGRIIGALSAYFDAPADTPQERGALFADAMALCNAGALGRVDSFNASYAFHRALLTTAWASSVALLLALALSAAGVGSSVHTFRPALAYLLVLAVLFTAIEFVRGRQRGEYFSIEVLNTAYLQTIDSELPRAAMPPGKG
ncbi:MAG TPA: hypothetical protein VGH93_02955 [Solirubrobacteraceae bacterium]